MRRFDIRPFGTTTLAAWALATSCILAIAQEFDSYPGKSMVLNAHALPLGDGRISQQPRRGYLLACQSQFMGSGAHRDGTWISGTTWDATRKLYVFGEVRWPQARFSAMLSGTDRLLEGNGLPTMGSTGVFPVQRSDPAFAVDRNPNSITEQTVTVPVPAMPVMAPEPACVPMGPVGYMLNGVALFNAVDDAGRDAVAHEVQDRCGGHPERSGRYHYHGVSNCVPGAAENQKLLGYAIDGYGIYSMFDANGRELTNADLDECHGRTAKVLWDGELLTMYHYVMTREYPYSVGCLRGRMDGRSTHAPRRMGLPPPGARPGGPPMHIRPAPP